MTATAWANEKPFLGTILNNSWAIGRVECPLIDTAPLEDRCKRDLGGAADERDFSAR
jgi:hypothetical protein